MGTHSPHTPPPHQNCFSSLSCFPGTVTFSSLDRALGWVWGVELSTDGPMVSSLSSSGLHTEGGLPGGLWTTVTSSSVDFHLDTPWLPLLSSLSRIPLSVYFHLRGPEDSSRKRRLGHQNLLYHVAQGSCLLTTTLSKRGSLTLKSQAPDIRSPSAKPYVCKLDLVLKSTLEEVQILPAMSSCH